MNSASGRKLAFTAQSLAYIALFAATLTGGKLALSAVPNIEIVTILILAYGSVFGVFYVLPATLIFCAVETMIYGFGTWVVSYFIYWPALGVLAAVLRALILGVAATAFFGVLTTSVDVVFVCINQKTASVFFKYFAAKYMLGIWFYVAHIASSVVSTLVLYSPLCRILSKIKSKTFGAAVSPTENQ